jgi:ParB-like chromosome segregation protein Spo0J
VRTRLGERNPRRDEIRVAAKSEEMKQMVRNPSKPEYGRRRIDQLREHPKQQILFGDLPEAEFAALIASMKAHGLRDPVQVGPDGMILKGHQRVRAAKSLGWNEIDVIVRHDLAEDPVAAEIEFVEDNANRRQLDSLGLARCIKHLRELEKQQPVDLDNWTPRLPLRDRLGQRFGFSGRHVDRLLAIIETPLSVQQAVSRQQLKLVHAEKVARLSTKQQLAIDKAIEAGRDPAQVVAAYLTARPAPKNATAVYRRFLCQLEQAVAALDGQVRSLKGAPLPNGEAILARGCTLIRQLLRHERGRRHDDVLAAKRLAAAIVKAQRARPARH